MNQQKLNELVEQAYIYQMTVYEDNGVRTYGEREQVFSKEKFAELIVTECLKQTELARCSFNSQPQYTDKQNALVDEGFTWGADSCKDKIKQHFGVKE